MTIGNGERGSAIGLFQMLTNHTTHKTPLEEAAEGRRVNPCYTVPAFGKDLAHHVRSRVWTARGSTWER